MSAFPAEYIAKIRRESENAKGFMKKVLHYTFSSTYWYQHTISTLSERLCYVYATPMLQKGKGTPKERQRST